MHIGSTTDVPAKVLRLAIRDTKGQDLGLTREEITTGLGEETGPSLQRWERLKGRISEED